MHLVMPTTDPHHLSIIPIKTRLYGADVSRPIPSFRQNDLKSEDTNSFAPSETINLGFPMSAKKFWNFSKHFSLLLIKYTSMKREKLSATPIACLCTSIDSSAIGPRTSVRTIFITSVDLVVTSLGTALRFALFVSHVSQTSTTFHSASIPST